MCVCEVWRRGEGRGCSAGKTHQVLKLWQRTTSEDAHVTDAEAALETLIDCESGMARPAELHHTTKTPRAGT